MELTHNPIPDGLLPALDKWRGKYTDARFLYYSVELGSQMHVGVFGDGPNGNYEWFIWDGGKLRTSNRGYGGTHWALRDVLIECREDIELEEKLAEALNAVRLG